MDAPLQSHTSLDPSRPESVRAAIRAGTLDVPTSGYAPGYLQGNLAILPESQADAFLRFCVANPKPCPLLAVGAPGDPYLPKLGAGLDIRTDLARYQVFRAGVPAETAADLGALWREDFVAFVLGCSFSFEAALTRAGIRVAHAEAGRNVPMYVTDIATEPAGAFSGPMVVSMRPFPPAEAIRAITLSERQPLAHGAPVHFGDPAAIGIADIDKPDFGDAPVIRPGEVPVFWACGVTPQNAIRAAAPEIAVTHAPGHMLVTDLLAERGA